MIETLKVTVDDGQAQRVFAPSGDSVKYTRNNTVEAVPNRPGGRWATRVITKHLLEWETVTYE